MAPRNQHPDMPSMMTLPCVESFTGTFHIVTYFMFSWPLIYGVEYFIIPSDPQDDPHGFLWPCLVLEGALMNIDAAFPAIMK